jgi:hypothetical protein
MRAKKCPECGEKYQPTRPLQPCCEKDDCRVSYAMRHIEAKRKRQKMQLSKAERIAAADDRKTIKIRKEAIKTRGDYTKEAQREFNAYIRWRDRAAGLPCISSGRPLDWSSNSVDAGHYRSTGSAPHLRFDERNCHAQSKMDNRYLAGNAVDYRINLIARIGLEAVEALEADNEPRKYTVEQLKAIKDHYIAKRKELMKQLAL